MHIHRQVAAVLVATVVASIGVVADSKASGCGENPLAVAGVPRQQSSGAWLIDLRTGCEWGWGRTDRQFPAASTAKVAVLAVALDQVAAGRRSLVSVDSLARRMIESSDNDAAVALWRAVGGSDAVASYLRTLGLRQFTPWPSFGGIALSPHDLAWLIDRVVGPASALPPDLRDYARARMLSVQRDQRFGVSVGLPPGWTTALKDGWFLVRRIDRGTAGHWRVNSAGVVLSPTGAPAWVLSVMGDDWPTMSAGVAEIERVSRVVAGALAR